MMILPTLLPDILEVDMLLRSSAEIVKITKLKSVKTGIWNENNE